MSTTVTIEAASGEVMVGDIVTIAGDDESYVVTDAHEEDDDWWLHPRCYPVFSEFGYMGWAWTACRWLRALPGKLWYGEAI